MVSLNIRNFTGAGLLFVSFCILSFQQSKIKRMVIVAYREPELMYGNIKQVIELRDRVPLGDKTQLVPDDTTLFDKKGDPIRTSFGVKGDNSPSYTTYYTKYDSGQWSKETNVYVGRKLTYYFDHDGRVVKCEEPGPTQPLSYILYHYNSAGELSGSETYDYHNNLRFRERFEYDLDGLLISADGRLIYKYLSRDAIGNWTKRIATWDKNHIDTVERKIIYY
ncbi:MAG: hypothetical protein ACHQHN_10885 [Sphingobacteriales bacterium]